MKRFFCTLLVLSLLPIAALADSPLPEQLTLAPGDSKRFKLPFKGYWDSEDPDVASGEGNVVSAYAEGCTVLSLVSPDGEEFQMEVEVTADGIPAAAPAAIEEEKEEAAVDDSVPAVIRRAIEIGIQEWRENLGNALPRSDSNKPAKGNKYCVWWGYDCGWCGAFANYCMDTAGVPLEPSDTYKKLKPLGSGDPHGVREAAVPKLDTGFTNMDRVTQDDPRPGYLVIYGRLDSKSSSGSRVSAYAFVHVGIVTAVEDLGGGRFLISTVEGNLSNRIKRFTYVYDSNSPANKNKPDSKANLNISAAPDSVPQEPDIQYTPHQDTWYVTEFCRTWY
ncbi:MAG: CHAP domain-containing protein [Clostridia bacterium]|nr:CHAP domain-containing protein [Clostridia bacterium]